MLPTRSSAHVWLSPAAIAITPAASPETPTAASRRRVVPSPTWPNSLPPQHSTAPSVRSAQLWRWPRASAVAPPERPCTSTGVSRRCVVPSPSWPYWLSPQHLTPPPRRTAQLWLSPPATAMTPLARPDTAPGLHRSWVVPSPSCPRLLSPQHSTPPSLVSAQV